jgi:hypothetical protein
VCRTKWMKESVDIQKRNFQLLQEFGSIQWDYNNFISESL